MRTLTRRQRIGAAVLAAFALMFLSFDFAGSSLSSARGGTHGLLGSLYRGTDAIFGPLRRFVQGIPDVNSNRAEIARLQKQNQALKRQLADAQANADTLRQLGVLGLAANSANWSMQAARVTATGPGSGFEWTVTLDVGKREGVLVGQTVTNGFALVGRVVRVDDSSSVVLLAADPASGVGVRDTRSGSLLLATGAAEKGLTASALDDQADVKVGDHLVTGPAGDTTFVAGVEVGVVTKVSRRASGELVVTVRPTAPQSRLDVVGVVLTQPRVVARPPIAVGQGPTQ